MTPAIAMLLDTVAKAKGKKKLVEGKGAWQHAKDEAKKRGKGDNYAAAIAHKIMGKSAALDVLNDTLNKANGEGSRGGHVVGHAPSGAAQYAAHGPVIGRTKGGQHVFRDAPASHPLYAKMTQRDHMDAHKIHIAHDGDKHGHGLSHWASVRAKKAV